MSGLCKYLTLAVNFPTTADKFVGDMGLYPASSSYIVTHLQMKEKYFW
jgi:hypothetical protein